MTKKKTKKINPFQLYSLMRKNIKIQFYSSINN